MKPTHINLIVSMKEGKQSSIPSDSINADSDQVRKYTLYLHMLFINFYSLLDLRSSEVTVCFSYHQPYSLFYHAGASTL